jgi:hypothetical protein
MVSDHPFRRVSPHSLRLVARRRRQPGPVTLAVSYGGRDDSGGLSASSPRRTLVALRARSDRGCARRRGLGEPQSTAEQSLLVQS